MTKVLEDVINQIFANVENRISQGVETSHKQKNERLTAKLRDLGIDPGAL